MLCSQALPAGTRYKDSFYTSSLLTTSLVELLTLHCAQKGIIGVVFSSVVDEGGGRDVGSQVFGVFD